MGNILSFFFPQPDPPSIEQVEEVREEKSEETIAEEIKDAVNGEDTKSANMVDEKDIEPEEHIHTDEGFEVVEEATLSQMGNNQHDKVTDLEPESNATNKNPVPPFKDDTELEGPCCDLTLEPNIDEIEIKMVENALRVESNSPAGVEEIGSIQDENVKIDYDYDVIIEPETVSTSEAPVADEPEPVNRSMVETTMLIPDPIKTSSPKLPVQLQEDIADKEIVEEPEICFEPGSKKYVLPDSMKGQTPEPTEDLSDLLVKVPCPEVEVIGSISDSKPKEVAMDSSFTPGSSFCGTVIPSKHLNEQLKEDKSVAEAESQEVHLQKDVSGGVEGLKDVLTESNLQDFEVKEDSPATEAPVKSASLIVEVPNEVSGGVEGLKSLLTESSKVEE